jgi:hypothetical protein
MVIVDQYSEDVIMAYAGCQSIGVPTLMILTKKIANQNINL